MSTVACTNPAHDHFCDPGEEVCAHWAPPDAVRYGDGTAVIATRAQRHCNDCGKPAHYDTGAENYAHDDPDARCFLIGDPLEGTTPCR